LKIGRQKVDEIVRGIAIGYPKSLQ